MLQARRDYAPWLVIALDYANSSGLDVLDVGCGQGVDICEYAQAGARVTGIDLTPRHVELARAHLDQLGLTGTVVESDAEHMPFPDGTFDRVSSTGVLHHTPDMPAALREILRVLRPGGTATVIVYNRNSWHYWAHQVLLRGIATGGIIREHGMAGVLSANVERGNGRPLVRVYTQMQMRKMLLRAGFASVVTSVSPFRPSETFFTKRLRNSPRIGHGWYVIARGQRRAY